jgi:RecB family exonuclease
LDEDGKRKIILIQLLDKKPDIKLLNLSVSKAKTFKDCAKKFKFTYIDKLPRKEWDFHVFGKYCHLVLELFHTELIKNPDLCCTNLFSECQDKALETWGAKLTSDQKQLAYDVLQNYLNNWIDKRKTGLPEIIAVEKEFFLLIDDKVLLNGFIDRLQRDIDGMYHVADYKTSKDKKWLKNDAFQLLTYALVATLLYPGIDKVRGSYIMLKHNSDVIEKEFSLKEINKVKDVFLKYAEDIGNEKLYRANPTPLCTYCDHVGICGDSFQGYKKKEVTTGPKKFGETDW